jgi:hypothetical protein
MGIAGVVELGCPFKLPFRDGDWLLRYENQRFETTPSGSSRSAP